MIQKKDILKLVDYILLNSASINSSGLYNGKVGVSLSLFEASRYLNDKNIENKAFQLLQESLVAENKDYGFENGLSGIGYVLLYLIENKFIDADFNEIFGEKYESLIKRFTNLENEPHKLLSSFHVIYFFAKIRDTKKDDRISRIVPKIFEGIELYLSLQFFDFNDRRYTNNKSLVLNVFKQYLKLVDFACYSDFSQLLLDSYAQLYRNGKIVSNYYTGCLLENIVKDKNDYQDIIQDNKQYGLLNFHNCSLHLHEQIDLLSLLQQADSRNGKDGIIKTVEKEWVNSQPKNSWDKLNYRIPQYAKDTGYGFGLSRLLVFVTNKKHLFV
ncbi:MULTISPECIES: lanthionine synthetase LanC family protein [Proteiniphilum]|uniref:lanthionine synthetase LanC family protein n=1 Tax=Proteiniphilum TaxID=294702 RepID=UPI00036A8F2C|nr:MULTISPECIES: lanthionine synthetase LanC family protein [Proteiniphilum]